MYKKKNYNGNTLGANVTYACEPCTMIKREKINVKYGIYGELMDKMNSER